MKRSLPIVAVMLILALVVQGTLLVQAADESVTITLSDTGGKATAQLSDFAEATGWTTNIVDGTGKTVPNPQNKKQHTKQKLEQHIKEVVKAYRAQKKADTARQKEITDTEAEFIFK